MEKELLEHYREFSMYTFPGGYLGNLQRDLPDDVREIGLLIRKNTIHNTTLAAGNVATNADLRFGDMTLVPWYRQREDDMLPTAASMLAELYRRDSRGIVMDRRVQDKLVVSCRHVAILTASVLKSKGIPARVRSGHADYFEFSVAMSISTDHWITEYWSESEQRWVTIDVDGSLSLYESFDPYDLPVGKFDFPAASWLAIRGGKVDPLHFWNAKPERGVLIVLWSLFYDFHCLMNDEILYIHGPRLTAPYQFANSTPGELHKIDNLAQLMLEPERNFVALKTIWDDDKDFRLLGGGLL